MKINVSQEQSNWFAFKEASAYKRGVRRSATWIVLVSSTTATHGDAVTVLSSVFITAQNDARNIVYLISWLQKVSLEQLLFDQAKVLFPIL